MITDLSNLAVTLIAIMWLNKSLHVSLILLFLLFFTEASQAICVRAVKSFSNSNDPQSLAFAAGDIITVCVISVMIVRRGLL